MFLWAVGSLWPGVDLPFVLVPPRWTGLLVSGVCCGASVGSQSSSCLSPQGEVAGSLGHPPTGGAVVGLRRCFSQTFSDVRTSLVTLALLLPVLPHRQALGVSSPGDVRLDSISATASFLMGCFCVNIQF